MDRDLSIDEETPRQNPESRALVARTENLPVAITPERESWAEYQLLRLTGASALRQVGVAAMAGVTFFSVCAVIGTGGALIPLAFMATGAIGAGSCFFTQRRKDSEARAVLAQAAQWREAKETEQKLLESERQRKRREALEREGARLHKAATEALERVVAAIPAGNDMTAFQSLHIAFSTPEDGDHLLRVTEVAPYVANAGATSGEIRETGAVMRITARVCEKPPEGDELSSAPVKGHVAPLILSRPLMERALFAEPETLPLPLPSLSSQSRQQGPCPLPLAPAPAPRRPEGAHASNHPKPLLDVLLSAIGLARL